MRNQQPPNRLEFSAKELRAELMREAKVLKIPSGMATSIVKQVVQEVEPWVMRRQNLTTKVLNQKIAKITKKYHEDLAFIYENRDKII